MAKIHVIGDSHTLVFNQSKLFVVHHVGPATAYNLGNISSSTKSNQKLFNIIKNVDKSDDIVLLVFGEIDCRIHIYYRYMKNKRTKSITELIDETILNYGVVLKKLVDLDVNFCICGVPAAGFEENIYKYPFYAEPGIRSQIYKEFNDHLRQYCHDNCINYINIYDVVADKNGFISDEYSADDVHLNKKIIPFIEKWIIDTFGTKIYKGSIDTSTLLSEALVMDTFEIRDEEIDVEEIMRKIREKIRMRREAGIYPEGDIEETHPAPDHQDLSGEGKPIALSPEARRDLDYINSNLDVENKGYFISSHRPVAGKFLIKGRELVHGEVRRYVDPAIWKQREFNGSVVRLLNEVARSVEQISAKLASLEDDLRIVRSEISQKRDGSEIDRMKSELFEAIEAEISKTRSEIDASIAQLDTGIEERIDAKVGLARTEIDTGISQLDTGIEERIDAKVGQARTEIDASIAQLDTGIEERIDAKVCQAKSEIDAGIAQLDTWIEGRIKREANSVISAMNQDIQNKAWLASILEGRLADFEDVPLTSDIHSDYEGINYFVFEEAFRGSREEIKKRQAAFVQYFEGSKNVLDIGCGRGEFLEHLRDGGIGGRGIDLNEDMVQFCRSRGLDVERIDAIAYLEGLEDKSLDGVFLDQVVEHLRSDYMVKMLGLCYKKLKYGHYIVVETVNPLSFASLANFYMDLTHVRPVHPETLRFLFQSVGFREVEVMFLSPLSDEERLKKANIEGAITESLGKFVKMYEENVDIINSVLYGAQDYVIIGKK